MRKWIVAGLAIIAGWTAVVGQASALDPDSVQIEIQPDRTSTPVGVPVTMEIVVTNNGPDSTAPMAVHIDITDPASSSSTDPEDWTPELTRPIGALAPGESVRLDWSLEPISGGDYAVFAVLLNLNAGLEPAPLAISAAAAMHVEENRGFNPQGVTPLAIGMPLAILAALLWRRRRLSAGEMREASA